MVCYGVDKGYRDMWNEYWHVSTRNRGSGIGGAFPMNLGDDVRIFGFPKGTMERGRVPRSS